MQYDTGPHETYIVRVEGETIERKGDQRGIKITRITPANPGIPSGLTVPIWVLVVSIHWCVAMPIAASITQTWMKRSMLMLMGN